MSLVARIKPSNQSNIKHLGPLQLPIHPTYFDMKRCILLPLGLMNVVAHWGLHSEDRLDIVCQCSVKSLVTFEEQAGHAVLRLRGHRQIAYFVWVVTRTIGPDVWGRLRTRRVWEEREREVPRCPLVYSIFIHRSTTDFLWLDVCTVSQKASCP